MCILLQLESERYGDSQDTKAFSDTQVPAWMEGKELSLET